MTLNFILFPLFLIVLFLAGELFLYLGSLLCRLESRFYPSISVNGLLGLFFLAIAGVCVNFFQPLASAAYYSLIIGIIFFGIIVVIVFRRFPSKYDVALFFIVAIVLAPLAGSMQPGYDGGLYHLPHQLWLRTDRIVFGLANFHGRFGFASLYEYLAAPLWLHKNFLLISYLQASFVCFFALFLIDQVKSTAGTHQILVLGVITCLAGYHGYIPLLYSYTDIPAGFSFVAAFLYGHMLISVHRQIYKKEWFIFTLLVISSIFYKGSAILILLWLVCVIFIRFYLRQDSFKGQLKVFVLPSLFLFIWLVRNYLISGCFIFPWAETCVDVSWSAYENAVELSKDITAWARHPWSGFYSLTDSSWFQNWWLTRYRHVGIKLVLSGLFVAVVYTLLLLKPHRKTHMKIGDLRYGSAVCFVVLALFFWFLKAPNPRFGIGPIALLFPVALIFLHCGEEKIEQEPDQFIKAFAIIGVIIFIFRIGDPLVRIKMVDQLYTVPKLMVPQNVPIEKDSFGVRPLKTNQCWLVPECSPEIVRSSLNEYYGYQVLRLHKKEDQEIGD